MSKYIGKRYGKLTVLEVFTHTTKNGNNFKKAKCKCSCGEFKTVYLSNIICGVTKSCGCDRRNVQRKQDHRFWSRARCILNRCNDPKHRAYKNYGGRGIECRLGVTIWQVVMSIDSIPGFFEGAELDRIDNNGHYEKSNLRWVSKKENLLNKRTSVGLKSLETVPRTKFNIKVILKTRNWSIEDFELICVSEDTKPKLYIAKHL